jgi:prohibitin 1
MDRRYVCANSLCWIACLCAVVQERNAAIIRAEGESESAKLISDATKAAGAGLVELRRIEAAKDIAESMSKSPNVVYLPSGNNMLLGLNPR